MRTDHPSAALTGWFSSRRGPWRLAGLAVACLAATCTAAEPAAKEDEPVPPPPPQVLSLPTSDGVAIAAWFYGVASDVEPLATVILVHDLGGSHETVEPLAKALQEAGCNVVAPDLRGHGKSEIGKLARATGEAGQSALLKSADFAAMTASSGGRFRKQAAVRGDLEVVRNWIKERSDQGSVKLDDLYLVGSGLGATVAATWAVQDAAWPPIATGMQGGDLRGLVLVDPAFVTKGFSIGKTLALEPLKSKLPVMVISGDDGGDATKVFDQLKRNRPTAWFDSRLYDAEARRNTSPAKDSDASLWLIKLGGRLAGDKLAAARSADARQPDPARLILTFINVTAGRR
jgi:alpha-beta hydrolase superfamily lysophospholipase